MACASFMSPLSSWSALLRVFGTCQTSGIPSPAQLNLQERCSWEYGRWNGQEEGHHPPALPLMDLQLSSSSMNALT